MFSTPKEQMNIRATKNRVMSASTVEKSMRTTRFGLTIITCAMLCAGPVMAGDLAVPKGEVILAATGHISQTNAPSAANFDLEMLKAMEPVSITTSTIWTNGVHRFTGVSLKQLVDQLGMTGETLKMTAINDYMVEVPVSDAVEGGPILAYEMDGQVMSVRDKGPLWLIYPFDTEPHYKSEVYYSRSIWQLNRIEATN